MFAFSVYIAIFFVRQSLFIYTFALHYLQLLASNSPWLEKLRAEIKYFEDIKIDIDKLIAQNRESDKIRGQMNVLERRVQVRLNILFIFLKILTES